MTENTVLTRAEAVQYQRAGKVDKQRILDELCAATGWHRDHARKALRTARGSTPTIPSRLPALKYGPEVLAALASCWSLLGMPAGKRLAPALGELVPILRRFGELDIDEHTAQCLIGMSAATIDRRLASERRQRKSQTPALTWTCGDEAVPGFVDVCLVPHDGGSRGGQHAWTLTVTDTATRWTEKRSICGKSGSRVLAALDDIVGNLPFPIVGIDCDVGTDPVIEDLVTWCAARRITFARSGSRSNDDGRHADQKNRAAVHALVGYHRYDTAAEVLLLNKIWKRQAILSNYFYPHQKLVSKVRTGAKVSKKYGTAATPRQRAEAHQAVSVEDKAILADTYAAINPAAVQRQIRALVAELHHLTESKAGYGRSTWAS